MTHRFATEPTSPEDRMEYFETPDAAEKYENPEQWGGQQAADLDLAGLEALLASPAFADSEGLDLRSATLADGDFAALVQRGALAQLRSLSVAGSSDLGDESMKAIAAGGMPKLERIDVSSTSVTDAGLEAIAEATEQVPNLQHVQGKQLSKIETAAFVSFAFSRPGETTLSLSAGG